MSTIKEPVLSGFQISNYILRVLCQNESTRSLIKLAIIETNPSYVKELEYMFGLVDGKFYSDKEMYSKFNLPYYTCYFLAQETKYSIFMLLSKSYVEKNKEKIPFFNAFRSYLPVDYHKRFDYIFGINMIKDIPIPSNIIFKFLENISKYLNNFLYNNKLILPENISIEKNIPKRINFSKNFLNILLKHNATKQMLKIVLNSSSKKNQEIISFYFGLLDNKVHTIIETKNYFNSSHCYNYYIILKTTYYKIYKILKESQIQDEYGNLLNFFEAFRKTLTPLEAQCIDILFENSDESLSFNNDLQEILLQKLDYFLSNNILLINNRYILNHPNEYFIGKNERVYTYKSRTLDNIIDKHFLYLLINNINTKKIIEYAILQEEEKYHEYLNYYFGLKDGFIHNSKETIIYFKGLTSTKGKFYEELNSIINDVKHLIFNYLKSSFIKTKDNIKIEFFDAFTSFLSDKNRDAFKKIYVEKEEDKLTFDKSPICDQKRITKQMALFLNLFKVEIPDFINNNYNIISLDSDITLNVLGEFLKYLDDNNRELSIIMFLINKNYPITTIAKFLNKSISEVEEIKNSHEAKKYIIEQKI